MALAFGALAAILLFARLRDGDTGSEPFVINESHSMTPGIYARAAGPIQMGVIATVLAKDVAPDYAASRAFTGPHDRFLKRVAALHGDIVCADAAIVTINGRVVAERRPTDAIGRPLPTWSGCIRLTAGEVLLLGDSDDSFDGRYWGPVQRSLIEGIWRKL